LINQVGRPLGSGGTGHLKNDLAVALALLGEDVVVVGLQGIDAVTRLRILRNLGEADILKLECRALL
jgi:hypothetical protein